MTLTSIQTIIAAPLLEITTKLESKLGHAQKVVNQYEGCVDSPHAQDWRERLALLERAERVWREFMASEGLEP